jgi:hypothetical protein
MCSRPTDKYGNLKTKYKSNTLCIQETFRPFAFDQADEEFMYTQMNFVALTENVAKNIVSEIQMVL